MKNTFSNPVSMLLLVVLFFALVLLNNQLFQSARFDLTEEQVYSLSDGSKEILSQIDEPIHLYLFFSEKSSEGLTTLRNYANRVQSLLKEYESAANGNLKLHLVDPEAFSEAEDQAVEFGLTGAALSGSNEAIYFGLAGRNALDDELNIPFFDPQKERFLEYDISQLIYQLTSPNSITVGVLSGIDMAGGQNPMTGQYQPPWRFYSQLQELYTVQTIAPEAGEIPQSIDVLLLIHPKDLTENMRYSIDQFVLGGGKLVAFVDPHHETDPMAAMSGMGSVNSSDLGGLFKAWGINVNLGDVVLDAAMGLELRTQTGVVKHMGVIGLDRSLLDEEDVVTSSLDVINGASFGSLGTTEDSKLGIIPLIHSSEYSSLTSNMTYAMTRDPAELAGLISNEQQSHVLAARFSGIANSAFDSSVHASDGSDETKHIEKSELNVLVVADTDLLADRLWVTQANFFGQMVFTPFADNGALLTNAVENMGGSDALISIRSRGTYSRPFTKVQELTVKAEMKFREQEQLLEQRLIETEQKLSELETQEAEGGMLVLTPEQQATIEDFNQQRIDIRKELREVRHQLDKDIERLGSLLKFINIAVMPVLLVFLLMFATRAMRVKSDRQIRSTK